MIRKNSQVMLTIFLLFDSELRNDLFRFIFPENSFQYNLISKITVCCFSFCEKKHEKNFVQTLILCSTRAGLIILTSSLWECYPSIFCQKMEWRQFFREDVERKLNISHLSVNFRLTSTFGSVLFHTNMFIREGKREDEGTKVPGSY